MRSVVPCYDVNGKCGGYVSRFEGPACSHCGRYHLEGSRCWAWDAKKWLIMDDFKKSEHLYNFRDAWNSSLPSVVLVEGPGCVWKLAEARVTAAVASLGADLSEHQANKLLLLGRRVLVAYDNDEAGRDGAQKALKVLHDKGHRADQLFVPKKYHDVAEMPASAVAEWVRQAAGV